MHVVANMWLKKINVGQCNSWHNQIPNLTIIKTHQAKVMRHVGVSVYLNGVCFS